MKRLRLRRACRLVDQGLEGLGLAHGEVCEDLAVNRNSRNPEAVDKSAVGQTVLADRSVDALDPKRAEIALPKLAADVGMLARLVDGGVRGRDVVLAAAAEALGLLQDLLAA